MANSSESTVDPTKLMSPEEVHKYEHLCSSYRTVVRRMEGISTHLYSQPKENMTKVDYYSIALDETCNNKDTQISCVFS